MYSFKQQLGFLVEMISFSSGMVLDPHDGHDGIVLGVNFGDNTTSHNVQ